MLVAIETSCDETAVSVLDIDALLSGAPFNTDLLLAEEVASQVRLHEAYGGVVPELAARQHITSLPIIFDKALAEAGIGVKDISYVAATRGPGLKGCLLVGLCFAKALAYGLGKPLLALNHLEGHIFAAELVEAMEFPALALVVSGGHTQLVLIKDFRSYQMITNTRDDAAGEAFDKSATIMGLPYPGGPALSKQAVNGDPKSFKLPIGVADDPKSFSFSGLKTAVLRTYRDLEAQGPISDQVLSDLAASVEYAIVEALVRKTVDAVKQYRPKSVVLTGGVAANPMLRRTLSENMEALDVKCNIPPFKLCTDNGSMIAALAARMIQNDPETYSSWQPADQALGPEVDASVGAVARWPLGQDL
jgi:N6-L-threonylcarbamoyladenine synthase